MIFGDWSIAQKPRPSVSRLWSQSRCRTYNKNMEGEKSIYKGSDTMWKLNPGVRTITLTKNANYTCKLLTKETVYGAEH